MLADTHKRPVGKDWQKPPAPINRGLEHSVGSQVERAYARSDLRDKRRALMEQWGEYVTEKRAKGVRPHG